MRSRFAHSAGSTKPAPGRGDGVHIETCGAKRTSAPSSAVARVLDYVVVVADQDARAPPVRLEHRVYSPRRQVLQDEGVQFAVLGQRPIA